MELQGKTAVITGGASGIGLATARRFAQSAVNLVLGDVEDEALRKAVAELESEGARVVGVHCDVALEADVVLLRETAMMEFGAAHLVFNNAGVVGGPTIGTPKSVWDWVMGVNIDGVINGINAFVPLFLDQDEGHVVNTASLAGIGGTPGTGAYCASKFAVIGISESLFHELELSGKHVGVSVLCPGFVRTRIHESQRNMPDELASFNEDPTMQLIADLSRSAVNAGIDPGDVAELVERGVRENRFWLLPHERVALRMTEQKLEWMRGGRASRIDLDAATQP